MDSCSDDDQLMLVPVALQSGQTTPSRLSQISDSNSATSRYMLHRPAHASGEWIANQQCTGIQAFPRPPSSVEDVDCSESGDGQSKPPQDLRIERRKRNQYKRHGSLTLALQQEQEQQRLSSEQCSSDEYISQDADLGYYGVMGTPMSTPVISYPRTVYQTTAHTQYAAYSGSDVRSRRSSAQTAIAAVTGSRFVSRLRSSSLMSSRADKQSARVDARYSGSRLRYSSDNDSVHDPSSSTGSFAPVNISRASMSSSRVQRASNERSIPAGISSGPRTAAALVSIVLTQSYPIIGSKPVWPRQVACLPVWMEKVPEKIPAQALMLAAADPTFRPRKRQPYEVSRAGSRNQRRSQLASNPPTNPLPLLPLAMDDEPQTDIVSITTPMPYPIHVNTEQIPDNAPESATHTANNTAVCTPVAARTRGDSTTDTSGDFTKVGEGQQHSAATQSDAAMHGSPTHYVTHKQPVGPSNCLKPWAELSKSAVDTEDAAPEAHLQGAKDQHNPKMHANGSVSDRQMHTNDLCPDSEADACAGHKSDLSRHRTLVFDQSPFCRASTLLNGSASVSRTASTLDENDGAGGLDAIDELTGMEFDFGASCLPVPVSALSQSEIEANISYKDECRASEEYAHEIGVEYVSTKGTDSENIDSKCPNSFVNDNRNQKASELSQPRTATAHPLSQTCTVSSRADERAAAEASLCRNSLFPNVVKQQSRCLSVLLQHGPHGGIRRIGPLLITRERGGLAIANLNPAFVEMMDVQPFDSETAAFLKRANIRRRSFSMPPNDASGNWLNSGAAGSGKQQTTGMSGPGMWWPLNDDNCSDEVVHEVHIASADKADGGAQGSLERKGSASTLATGGSKQPLPAGAPRKGSVSSQFRLMMRTESASNVNAGLTRTNPSQSSLGPPNHASSLTHMASDSSDTQTSQWHSGKASAASAQALSPSHHLADVTMKTEGGTITRSIKSISLRLLVNRLASPEGNADSDLMTDFLNSYRFFAHPIDVMRLIIIRYMNCFATAADDDSDTSEAGDADDDDEKFLTINGWRKGDKQSGKCAGDESRQAMSRTLPPLARNDGAIVQLRVMNIIKYWIKFHPHDFRLHHRLTRLLLLFLSHIQKQPGRAEFVNSIRQKLSSGKLLAVETPSFAGPSSGPVLPPSAMPSQATSSRSSEIQTTGLESTRSAIDLQSATTQLRPTGSAEGAVHGPRSVLAAGQLTSSVSASNLQSNQSRSGGTSRVATETSGAPATAASAVSSRAQHTKKGSTSYFKSLFHHRSNKSSASTQDTSGSGSDSEAFGGYNNQSVRISQRNVGLGRAELPVIGDGSEQSGALPNGNMYANDFGSVVMEALEKSGVPTPQTPVGRTLLNYSIANRNPYRVNLAGIDPATFAEQLTLLEHELFARIGATEFSLKGRVGNLETILHTMQGMGPDSRPGQPGANPVPSLTAMTSWFNQATYWAVLAVLSEPTAAARALVIKQLVHIAFHCLARRNYYGAFELAIALDNSAVRRLHETWQLIPPLIKDIVARILQVLQSRMNFRTYRESVKAAMAGASGPDEEMFSAVSEQIKALRAKDMIATSQASQASGSSSGTGLSNLMHGALFGSSGEESKHHSRKKSNAHGSGTAKDVALALPLLSEQDCACITYAIRIRAASFMYTDPSANAGDSGFSHSSVPVSSKNGRGSGAHLSSSSSRSNLNGNFGNANESSESRSRRARSTSNSNGAVGGRAGAGTFNHGRMITDGVPLPLVPFVAVHMTDLLHADEANSTYTDEHQKMRSRNPTGPEPDKRRQQWCDSASISSINQAQPLINMQKFRLITSMFRELHLAQRTKYPYAADKMLQQQIHSAVRNIKAQTNDVFAVVEDVAMSDPVLARPPTAYGQAGRSRAGSSASRQAELGDQMFGYPLYQIAALQKSQDGAPIVDASMESDCTDIKDNQELEQRLYMLSKWIEPASR
ncbi:hypothetical protein GGH19_000608 [Coemansia sp. RSA 1807]|nr:hypothetical protein IW142_000972 [Coemansia sp. RSA 564]KAJ2578277.1 hypothetical protein GGH19_000608 [Coemansia sp. RSA 1807]